MGPRSSFSSGEPLTLPWAPSRRLRLQAAGTVLRGHAGCALSVDFLRAAVSRETTP